LGDFAAAELIKPDSSFSDVLGDIRRTSWRAEASMVNICGKVGMVAGL
jgi:hypothetical protein